MPSLQMKTKSTTGCPREKNGLRVCQKSSMISKNSFSHVKLSQQAAEFETCNQSKQDVSLYNKLYPRDDGGNESGCRELLDGANLQLQKQQSPSTDLETVGRMESLPTSCTSNLETIFSPIPESVDNHSEPDAQSGGGCSKDLDILSLGRDDNSRSSSDYQSCNVSDFHISDMIVTGLPMESNSVYDDIAWTTSLPGYKCDEPSMFFDEEYMILPFLEDTMEARIDDDSRLREESNIDTDDSSIYLAIHQLRSCDEEAYVNTYTDWDQTEYFDPHMFIRNLPDMSDVAPNFHSTVSQETEKIKSITLVLDLDETLVHSTLEPCHDADFTFSVFVSTQEHTVYVKKRPYLRTFLEKVAEMFEIIVFTASQSIYAKQLLDILDPDGKLISRRAYRESCIFSDGSYTKDLTVLGVDLAKVAIVDNTPQVFQLQVNNGIPIKSWFDDPSDSALMSLLPFLETLVDVEDVRPIIAKRFGNMEKEPLSCPH